MELRMFGSPWCGTGCSVPLGSVPTQPPWHTHRSASTTLSHELVQMVMATAQPQSPQSPFWGPPSGSRCLAHGSPVPPCHTRTGLWCQHSGTPTSPKA